MRLCVLGPTNTVDRTLKIVKKAFPELDAYSVSYNVYTESLHLIDTIQQDSDAILFPGKASYRLCEKFKIPSVPWEYIPRHVSSIHRTMLEIQSKFKCGLDNISYDTLDRELILSAYEEIGISNKNAHFFLAEQHLLDPGYLPYHIEFHTSNYLHNGAGCCITGLTEIATALNQRKIPCAITLPPSALIVDTVNKLQLRYEAGQNLHSSIVVIMIKLTFSGNYSLLGNDDYNYMKNRISVLESIYSYSYRIDGTVVEEGNDGFLIFTTRRAIEIDTNYFKTFYLMDILKGCNAKNIAAGIGCGKTASESKSHAYAAMEMSRRANNNSAYVVLESGTALQPILNTKSVALEAPDHNFTVLSQKTNLSINTLYNIYKCTKRSMLEEFTSSQVASLCSLNIRTTDRIIQKLLDAGCCRVSGVRMTGEHGRPSRIFRFDWDKK